jgi:hypothetical protein
MIPSNIPQETIPLLLANAPEVPAQDPEYTENIFLVIIVFLESKKYFMSY